MSERSTESGRAVTTPWGRARVLEEAWASQPADSSEFACGAQLLETDGGERLLRFAYSTDGQVRRGPVTMREQDLARLAAELRATPELRRRLAKLVRR